MLSHQWEHCGDWIKELVDIVLPVAAASLLVSHEDRRQAVPRQAGAGPRFGRLVFEMSSSVKKI